MLSNPIVLCGLGRVGRRVLDYLQAAGASVVAIDRDVSDAELASTGPVRFLKGDFRDPETLARAGLTKARGILILTSDDLVNLSTLMAILHDRPGIRVVVRMFNPALVTRLGPMAANVHALSTSALTAPMLALIATTGGALAAFDLADDQPVVITEWTLPAEHSFVGRTVAEVASEGIDIVLHGRAGGPRRFFADLGSAVLGAGDSLVVHGRIETVERLTGIAEIDSVLPRGWVDSLRRTGRMLGNLAAEIDLPVKICTATLLVVIAVSVVIFHFGMRNDTLIDAFYRTISLMATGADMRGQDAEPGSWQKGFISSLRLLGVALTAAFTAILTNYLVRAQLRGALEVRRIPERGHIIVTGLGNVSFRALQELRRLEEDVVAIERNRDNPFIATARKLGAAVIVGDALIDGVLKQAHAAGAKAVIVATDDELANLEIALLIRELHPDKRLLVRLIDSRLAQLCREAANIHLALSIPELAAPAFLAAFLGDRIRTVLLADGQLLAVIDIVVRPDDSLAGQTARTWADRYRLLPLAIDSIPRRDWASISLIAGSVLTALVAFRDIHGLFERGGQSLGANRS